MALKDRRLHFSRGLHKMYLPCYHGLCDLLGAHWQPVSGYRTFEQQQRLYDMGRVAPGRIVTKAKPGLSYHNWGLASDWDRFDGSRYVPLEFNDPLWVEYTQACEKVGLRTIDWERPHNELDTRHRASKILSVFEQAGQGAVDLLLME